MSTGTGIEWTQATWNPVVGCTRASAGCDHCYAVTMTNRLEAMGQSKYAGLTVLNNKGDRHFNGQVRTVPEALEIPLHWRQPRKVFVNSMSDLFHRDVPFDFIDKVFAVMALCPQHTFQVLTKRPERMAEYLNDYRSPLGFKADENVRAEAEAMFATVGSGIKWRQVLDGRAWPLPNVWLGTSCEDQATFDARAPWLAKCPAAIRFLSLEPMLGPIMWWPFHTVDIPWAGGASRGGRDYSPLMDFIHWVIIGGESGKGARPFDIAWARSAIEQCKAAGVACFVKQLGADPRDGLGHMRNPGFITHAKGGEITEWPEDLRVREWPNA